MTEGERVKKLILTDKADFADIRRLGGLYVDKTKEIYNCIGKGSYFFLSRPRRFGKSLLCSTLKEMFSGNRELFKGLWLDGSDWLWQKHPIIHLSMIDMAGEQNDAVDLKIKLLNQLKKIAKPYALHVPDNMPIDMVFSNLVTDLYEKTGLGVVIIVDEYDKPILDLIGKPEAQKEVHSALRSFYGTFKALEASVRFVFLTGVYKFAKTSVFSSLNNLNDLTFDPKAGTLLGYTQEEMESYFSEEIHELAISLKISHAETLERLRDQYNGYHFGVNVNTGALSPGVYNPFGMNHTFAANQMLKKWFASGSPSFLIKKIKEGYFEEIGPSGLKIRFDTLNNSYDPDSITALSLLYYAGYATMSSFMIGPDTVKLVPPNLEVSQLISEELLNIFKTNKASDLFDIAWKIATCFRKHQFDDLKQLFNQALAQLTYQIIVSQEKYFQTVILLLLHMGKLHATAEIPTNDGRMDIVIETPSEIFIIEVKFNKSAADGLQQIKDKDYAKKFRGQGLPITAVGLSIELGAKADAKNCVFDVVVEQL